MNKRLRDVWKDQVGRHVAAAFPELAGPVALSTRERAILVDGTLLFRRELAPGKHGLVLFEPAPGPTNRFMVRVGWAFVDELRNVILPLRLPEQRHDGYWPRASAWGAHGLEILAGDNASLGWDIDPSGDVHANLSAALDEAMDLLATVLPRFFERIAATDAAGIAP